MCSVQNGKQKKGQSLQHVQKQLSRVAETAAEDQRECSIFFVNASARRASAGLPFRGIAASVEERYACRMPLVVLKFTLH